MVQVNPLKIIIIDLTLRRFNNITATVSRQAFFLQGKPQKQIVASLNMRLFSNLSPLPPSLGKGRGSMSQRGAKPPSLESLPSPLGKGRGIKGEGIGKRPQSISSKAGDNLSITQFFKGERLAQLGKHGLLAGDNFNQGSFTRCVGLFCPSIKFFLSSQNGPAKILY